MQVMLTDHSPDLKLSLLPGKCKEVLSFISKLIDNNRLFFFILLSGLFLLSLWCDLELVIFCLS